MSERGFITSDKYLVEVSTLNHIETIAYPDEDGNYELKAMESIYLPYGEIRKVHTGTMFYTQNDDERLVVYTPDNLLENGIQVIYKMYDQFSEIEIWLHNTSKSYYQIKQFDTVAYANFVKILK